MSKHCYSASWQLVSSPVFLLDESIGCILPKLSRLVQCSSFKIQLQTSQTWPLLYQYRYGTLSPSSISAHSLFNCTLGLTLAILTPLWNQPHDERLTSLLVYYWTVPADISSMYGHSSHTSLTSSIVISMLRDRERERERERERGGEGGREGRRGREGEERRENNKFGVFWMLYSLQVKLWLPCCSG